MPRVRFAVPDKTAENADRESPDAATEFASDTFLLDGTVLAVVAVVAVLAVVAVIAWCCVLLVGGGVAVLVTVHFLLVVDGCRCVGGSFVVCCCGCCWFPAVGC